MKSHFSPRPEGAQTKTKLIYNKSELRTSFSRSRWKSSAFNTNENRNRAVHHAWINPPTLWQSNLESIFLLCWYCQFTYTRVFIGNQNLRGGTIENTTEVYLHMGVAPHLVLSQSAGIMTVAAAWQCGVAVRRAGAVLGDRLEDFMTTSRTFSVLCTNCLIYMDWIQTCSSTAHIPEPDWLTGVWTVLTNVWQALSLIQVYMNSHNCVRQNAIETDVWWTSQ